MYVIIPNKNSILRLIVIFILVLVFSRSTFADDISEKEDPAWIDETMDEMVQPLKKWLEYNDKPLKKSSAKPRKSIRQAIKEATLRHPGVVLSVKKEDITYQIKILSKQGVIQLIDIPMALVETTP